VRNLPGQRYQLLLAYDRKPHDLYIRRHQPHAAELRSFVALDPGRDRIEELAD
jgi:hypothetical protein